MVYLRNNTKMRQVRRASFDLGGAVALAGLVLLLPSASKGALAEEFYYARQATQTNIAECKKGKIWELARLKLDVHSFLEELQVVCQTSESSAEWVFHTATSCDDVPGDEKTCAVEFLKTPGVFEEVYSFTVDGKPPFTMHYDALQWGLGTECTTVEQDVNDSTRHTESMWVCKGLDIDPTADFDGEGRLNPDIYWTIANEPWRVAQETDPLRLLPQRFLASPDKYTYKAITDDRGPISDDDKSALGLAQFSEVSADADCPTGLNKSCKKGEPCFADIQITGKAAQALYGMLKSHGVFSDEIVGEYVASKTHSLRCMENQGRFFCYFGYDGVKNVITEAAGCEYE